MDLVLNKYTGLGIRIIQDVAILVFLSTLNCVLKLVSLMVDSPDITCIDVTGYNQIYSDWVFMKWRYKLTFVLKEAGT